MKLREELKKRRIQQSIVAESVGCTLRSFQNKLSGRTQFTVKEALKIRREFLPMCSIEELFGG